MLHQYVQEFGDKAPKEINIINMVENTLKKAKGSTPEPIKTVFETLKESTMQI